ncbi:MAG: IS200/IS605 family element transposase accessory protein TnpB [Myxococcales bacterium]|nr:MAG: IS200/IS605 family element transposase accessory protein TnpB [Myxococcales bacterium]
MENVKRKITYRLYPSKKQGHEMSQILSLHQKLYNAALEQRINVYKSKKISLSYFDQARELTELRKFDEDYKKLNAQSSQVTLKRLDLAFKNFFRRVKNKSARAGFPRFKSYDRYAGWGYATHGDGWRLLAGKKSKNGYLRLSGVGHIKIRGQGKHVGLPKTCEIQHKAGKWYASITLECSVTRSIGENAIGIDWGLESFATVVNDKGTSSMIANPRFLKKELKQIKTRQRNLSRKKRGSNNRKKACKIVAKVHAKIANKRKEFLHQTTAKIIKDSALIAVEKLNVKNMSAQGGSHKKGLNREILSAAPGMFHQMLKYKAAEAGTEWIEIPTKQVKPSQTCHGCGKQEKKTLAERIHECVCGVRCTRDENAAQVILNWALFGNATGQELAGCGEVALVASMKHETPPTAALAA